MGTVEGGKKAAATNKMRYGVEFYRTIGKIGGTISRGGGFAAMDEWKLREASSKGGKKSRKPKVTA